MMIISGRIRLSASSPSSFVAAASYHSRGNNLSLAELPPAAATNGLAPSRRRNLTAPARRSERGRRPISAPSSSSPSSSSCCLLCSSSTSRFLSPPPKNRIRRQLQSQALWVRNLAALGRRETLRQQTVVPEPLPPISFSSSSTSSSYYSSLLLSHQERHEKRQRELLVLPWHCQDDFMRGSSALDKERWLSRLLLSSSSSSRRRVGGEEGKLVGGQRQQQQQQENEDPRTGDGGDGEDRRNSYSSSGRNQAESDEAEVGLAEVADAHAFAWVIRSLAEEGRRGQLADAHLRAERWLARMERHFHEERHFRHHRLTTNITTSSSSLSTSSWDTGAASEGYRWTIQAWSTADREDPALAVTRAERWLNKLVGTCVANGPGGEAAFGGGTDSSSAAVPATATTTIPIVARPTTECLNAFLDLCSKGRGLRKSAQNRSGGPQLAREHAAKAEHVLDFMIRDRLQKGARSDIAPNTESFNYVIRAWTRCRTSPDVADKSIRALRRMEEYQQKVDPEVRANARSYAMVMDSISARARLKVRRAKNHGAQSRNDPDRNGTNEVRLLQSMVDFLRQQQPQLVTTCVWNSLVSAWANLAPIHPGAPAEAERILQQMMASGDDEDSVTVVPPKPDATTYRLVMRAWANSSHPHRGQRTSWWLERQWAEHELDLARRYNAPSSSSSAPCPNVESYNTVMRVWADLRAPSKAEAALLDLLDRSAGRRRRSGAFQDGGGTTGDDDVGDSTDDQDKHLLEPNSESFALVIRGWLKVAEERGDKDALSSAVRWLASVRSLEQQEGSSSSSGGSGRRRSILSQVDMYGGILSAARRCASEHPDVLDLAVDAFDELRRSHHQVEGLHYSRLLQVGLLALSRPENDNVRSEFVSQLFSDCCEDGRLSKPFLQALANGPVYRDGWTAAESARIVGELLGLSPQRRDRRPWPLPPSWTRNVRQGGLLPDPHDVVRTRFEVYRHGADPYK